MDVKMIMAGGATFYNHRDHVIYQLGTYYDMRYMEYITRFRFILGLSKYDEDDSVYEREEGFLELSRDYDNNNWNILDNLKIQNEKREEKISDDCSTDYSLYHEIGEMMNQKKPFEHCDKVIDEFLLNTYLDLDEQELQVCRWVIWTIHDFCRRNVAEYAEIVGRMLLTESRRRDIFKSIKDIEDTIQRLVQKGILSQDLDRVGDGGKPFIVISFSKAPDEAIKAIDEIFYRDIIAFFGPPTNNNDLPIDKL